MSRHEARLGRLEALARVRPPLHPPLPTAFASTDEVVAAVIVHRDCDPCLRELGRRLTSAQAEVVRELIRGALVLRGEPETADPRTTG